MASRRKGELSKRAIDRGCPHQVTIPDAEMPLCIRMCPPGIIVADSGTGFDISNKTRAPTCSWIRQFIATHFNFIGTRRRRGRSAPLFMRAPKGMPSALRKGPLIPAHTGHFNLGHTPGNIFGAVELCPAKLRVVQVPIVPASLIKHSVTRPVSHLAAPVGVLFARCITGRI